MCNLALRIAVEEGNAAIVLVLLDKTPTDVDTDCEYIGYVLEKALIDRNLAVVKILLDHGAKFNATGGLYDNAMKIAAHSPIGELAMPLLLEKGAEEFPIDDSYSDDVQGRLQGFDNRHR